MVHAALFFSRRTPLNFFLPFFTSMNLPDVLSRFVQAVLPINLPLSCVRFFTAPMRRLSPTGSLLAIFHFLLGMTGALFEGHLKVRYPTVLAQQVVIGSGERQYGNDPTA